MNDQPTGQDVAFLRRVHAVSQRDVARAMEPPVSRQRVHQLEHLSRLSHWQFARLVAAILKASR